METLGLAIAYIVFGYVVFLVSVLIVLWLLFRVALAFFPR